MDIKKYIKKELEKNSDILIGVDDPEILELINILVDVFSKAIEKNNEKLLDEVEEMIKDESKTF
ncbi:hypothetical protein KAJ61_01020 [Candidatus Parcubacteria bacterium]|nr:hypothetical protein [Candidatus Parcubacteria bacterium]